MHGHGTFVFEPDHAIAAFGSPGAVAAAVAAMDMSHAWLRVHGRDGPWRTEANLALAEAFHARGIAVGVWGWNDGNDVGRDIANAHAAIELYDPYAYVADIETGVGGALWTPDRAVTFAAAVKAHLGDRPLVVSSFGHIATHAPEVMVALDAVADAFAPQVYWFRYPDAAMLAAAGVPPGVAPDDPVAYAALCLHQWRRTVGRPLILTGQAYWGEAEGWTQEDAERKLAAFLAGFDRWDAIIGLNWWNLSHPRAMSPRMREAIAAARLGGRFQR